MKEEVIKRKICRIIDSFFDSAEHDITNEIEFGEKLHIILSESIQALSLVVAIEEEFSIEFDDSDLDLRFFLNLDVIVDNVKGCLNTNQFKN